MDSMPIMAADLAMTDPMIQRAREVLRYDPDTGWLIWTVKMGRRGMIGFRAGSIDKLSGYRRVKLDGKMYREHRLIWAMETGFWPIEIDHINGVRDENIWANLREVNHKENHRNKKRYVKNTSGVTGVNWHKLANKWRAIIRLNGKTLHLGLFVDFEEAVTVRKAAEIEHGYHANHGR